MVKEGTRMVVAELLLTMGAYTVSVAASEAKSLDLRLLLRFAAETSDMGWY